MGKKNGFNKGNFFFGGKKLGRSNPRGKGSSKSLFETILDRPKTSAAFIGGAASLGFAFVAFNISDKVVFVPDVESPVIDVDGGLEHFVAINREFEVPFASCTDNLDEDCYVEADGIEEVDTSTLGTYVVSFNSIDQSGNEAKVNINVNVVLGPSIAGFEDGKHYNSDVTVSYGLGEGTVNGNPFASGTTFTNDGEYEILVSNDELGVVNYQTFVIDKTAPVITLNELSTGSRVGTPIPNLVDYFSVSDNFDTINFDINDITHNIDINTIGDYTVTLSIEDLAGNISTKSFIYTVTDSPLISNVIDNTKYSSSVIPHFENGVATLYKDGEVISYRLGDTISGDGNYRLEVENTILNETINVEFIIDKVAPTTTVKPNMKYQFLKGSAMPDFKTYFEAFDLIDGTIVIDNSNIENLVNMNANGTYTVTLKNVSDEAGNIANSISISITINEAPEISGVVDNGVYGPGELPLNINWSHGDATLNGVPISNNYTLSDEGSYTLSITSPTGDTSITFIIDKTAPTYSNVVNNTNYNSNIALFYNDNFNIQTAEYSIDGGSYSSFGSGYMFSVNGDYLVRLVDAAGNTTIVNFRIDKVAPTIDSGQTNNTYYDSPQSINFSDNFTGVIGQYRLNGGALTTFSNGDILFGQGTFEIIITDATGNTKTLTYTVDTTAPTFTSGQSNNDSFTSNQTITFLDNIDNTSLLSAVYSRNGGAQINFDTGDIFNIEGRYTFTITDHAGNQTSLTIRIDRTAPYLTSSQVENGVYNSDQTITFDDNVGPITASYTLNGGSSNTLFTGTTFTNSGEYVLTIVDSAGNTFTRTFKIDKIAPTFTSGQTDNLLTNQSQTITFNDTHTNVTGTYSFNGMNQGVFSSGDSFNVSGDYVFTITDQAGNTSTLSITIDKVVPNIGYLHGSHIDLGINSGEPDWTTYFTVFDNVDGPLSYTLSDITSTVNMSSIGTYNVRLTMSDQAGNTTFKDITVQVHDAPVVSGIDHLDIINYNPTISYDGIGDGYYTLDNGTRIAFSSGHTFSAEGHYVIEVESTVVAGISTTLEFTIDKTAPVITDLGEDITLEVNSPMPTLTNYVSFFDTVDGNLAVTVSNYSHSINMAVENDYIVTYTITDAAGNTSTYDITIYVYKVPTYSGVVDGGYYNPANITIHDGGATYDNTTNGIGNDGTIFGSKTLTQTGTYVINIYKYVNGELIDYNITIHVISSAADVTYPNGNSIKVGENNAEPDWTTYFTLVDDLGRNITITNGMISENVNTSTKGFYSVNFSYTDEVGNVTTGSITVEVVGSPEVGGVTEGGFYNSIVSPTFSESDAYFTRNGGAQQSIYSGQGLNLSGEYVLTVVSDFDPQVKTVISFTIDTEAPTIVTNPSGLPTTLDEGLLEPDWTTYFSASDNYDGVYTLNATMITENVDMNVSATYTVTLTITDSAGNTSSESISITIVYIETSAACFEYSTQGSKVTIDSYNYGNSGCGAVVNIPMKLGGKQVTTIGPGAFSGLPITSVTFTNKINTIGEDAFKNTLISNMRFKGNSDVNIGKDAFYGHRFTSINLKNFSTIDDAAFIADSSISSFTVTMSGDNTRFDSRWTTIFGNKATKA